MSENNILAFCDNCGSELDCMVNDCGTHTEVKVERCTCKDTEIWDSGYEEANS